MYIAFDEEPQNLVMRKPPPRQPPLSRRLTGTRHAAQAVEESEVISVPLCNARLNDCRPPFPTGADELTDARRSSARAQRG